MYLTEKFECFLRLPGLSGKDLIHVYLNLEQFGENKNLKRQRLFRFGLEPQNLTGSFYF